MHPLNFVIAVVGTLMFLVIFSFGQTSAPTDRKLDAIKDCNRLGGIYTEGTCQHPFAPICNRVGNTGTGIFRKRE